VANFVDGLADEENNAKNNTSVEAISDVFYVANRGWISVLFHDDSEGAPGEFEIFVTREGPYIYAIAFHYNAGAEAGAVVAEPVLTSFVAPVS
jgi:hypothetical protein